jgi:hypothetical protein
MEQVALQKWQQKTILFWIFVVILQWRLGNEKNNANKIKLDKFYKEEKYKMRD